MGATTIAVAYTPLYASKREAELVTFRSMTERVVIDVGPTISKPNHPDRTEQRLLPEALLAEF